MIFEKKYFVHVSKDAAKSFEKILQSLPAIGIKIRSCLTALEHQPYLGMKLKGFGNDMRRIRVGDYRIIYEIQEESLSIIIAYIGPRGDAYK